jgi:hypothetical protein
MYDEVASDAMNSEAALLYRFQVLPAGDEDDGLPRLGQPPTEVATDTPTAKDGDTHRTLLCTLASGRSVAHGWTSLHLVPFLQHPPETVAKVDLWFLKDHNTSEKPDSSGREQVPAAVGRAVSKRGVFGNAASTSGFNRPELQVGRPRKVEG